MHNEVPIKEDIDSWRSRVKKLFDKDPATNLPNPKLYFVGQCVLAGGLAGLFIGGRIGARVAAVEHIERTQLEVYQTRTHAERQYHGRVIIGFMRNGLRFGWRAGVFSGLYSLLAVVLNEINTGYMGTNFVAAGAFTGIVYNSLSGWRSMVVGAIIGSGLSLPIAGLAGLVGIIAPERKHELLYTNFVNHSPDIFERKTADVENNTVEEEDDIDYCTTFSEALKEELKSDDAES